MRRRGGVAPFRPANSRAREERLPLSLHRFACSLALLTVLQRYFAVRRRASERASQRAAQTDISGGRAAARPGPRRSLRLSLPARSPSSRLTQPRPRTTSFCLHPLGLCRAVRPRSRCSPLLDLPALISGPVTDWRSALAGGGHRQLALRPAVKCPPPRLPLG